MTLPDPIELMMKGRIIWKSKDESLIGVQIRERQQKKKWHPFHTVTYIISFEGVKN